VKFSFVVEAGPENPEKMTCNEIALDFLELMFYI
jgi:hypothetical protein